MRFVKLAYDHRSYEYESGSDLKMDILGRFLSCDVGFRILSYKEWTLNDSEYAAEGNITDLEKENGYICLRDLYSEEKVPTTLKMTTKQFIQMLDDWEAKVCKVRPQEVIITYHNNQFILEARQ